MMIVSTWMVVSLAAVPMQGKFLGGRPDREKSRASYVAMPKSPADFEWTGPRPVISRYKGSGTEKALLQGLRWLVDHQHALGYWSGNDFHAECERLGTEPCGGEGQAYLEVGLTGLGLMALTAAHRGGAENDADYDFLKEIGHAIEWLVAQANKDTGLIGRPRRFDFIYGHMLATYALCEAYDLIEEPYQRKAVQKAVEFVLTSRNPDTGWRYDVPPLGDNDTSVTVWAITILAIALEHDIVSRKEAQEAIAGGFEWIYEVTDKVGSGRVGYDSYGSLSARTKANEDYPRDQGEAMTAAAIWAHYIAGSVNGREELLEKQAKLLLAQPPILVKDLVKLRSKQDKERRREHKKKERQLEKGETLPALQPLSKPYPGDMYYWYHGTNAMFQVGGRPWKAWNKDMKKVVLKLQSAKGPARGSWDPDGPWGQVGGRVYSTAMMVLCLEVYFRYPRYE